MYMLDPDRGRRRRALARDQARSTANTLADAASAKAEDLANRARGMVAEARSFGADDEVPDAVLVARVRAQMGLSVANAHAIDVEARQGRVILRGPVSKADVDELLARVSSVRGVRALENQLAVQD
jgi:osmotically-inducible protein OsmY